MHYHYTKYYFFDEMSGEHEKRLQDIDWRYGGNVVSADREKKVLAISAMSRELLAVIEQEVTQLHISNFQYAYAGNEGSCEDEACVNPEAENKIQRTN